MVRVLKPGRTLILGEHCRWSLWAAQRRAKGSLGSKFSGAAHLRSRADLLALATGAGRGDVTVLGAVFYPLFGWAAKVIAPIDPWFGRWTILGAALPDLSATKPFDPRTRTEQP